MPIAIVEACRSDTCGRDRDMGRKTAGDAAIVEECAAVIHLESPGVVTVPKDAFPATIAIRRVGLEPGGHGERLLAGSIHDRVVRNEHARVEAIDGDGF